MTDLDAIRARYFGADDHRYYTGKTPRRDIGALLVEVERLHAELAEARDDINEIIRERDQITEKMLAELDAARAELAALKDSGAFHLGDCPRAALPVVDGPTETVYGDQELK